MSRKDRDGHVGDLLDWVEKPRPSVMDAFNDSHFLPQFPFAAVRNDDGEIVEYISTDDFAKNEHKYKGRICCPECSARLKFTPEEDKIAGTSGYRGFAARRAYFSSYGRSDHKEDCDYLSKDEQVKEKVNRRVEFFASDMNKILYWNLSYGQIRPSFYEDDRSPMIRDGVIRSAKYDESVKTYSVSNMKQFMRLSRYKDFSDPFWNNVSVYNEEHSLPFRSFFKGLDLGSVLVNGFNNAAYGVREPVVMFANMPEHNALDTNYRQGHSAYNSEFGFRLESHPMKFLAPDHVRELSVQAVLCFRNEKIYHKIKDGGYFAIHGVSSVTPMNLDARLDLPKSMRHHQVFIDMSRKADVSSAETYMKQKVREGHSLSLNQILS